MRRLFVGAAMAIALAGCGALPGGASANDPVGAVNRLADLVEAKQFTQLASAVCTAKQAEVAARFDPSRQLASTITGLDASAALDAMTISFADLQVTEVSRTGDTAVVAIDGTLNISFDEARMRPLLEAVVQQQGLPPSTLDSMLDGLAARSLPIDSQLEVVNENGTWLVCDSPA